VPKVEEKNIEEHVDEVTKSVANTPVNIRQHSMHFNFLNYTSGKLKFKYPTNVYAGKNTSLSTMASYIEKIIGFTSWVSSLETTPSPSIKTKKSSTSAPVNTMTPTPRTTETGTQVQVSTPKSKPKFKPISVTTSTIETQTIENPELLAYTDEQLIGHYTQEILQPEPVQQQVAVMLSPEEQTYTCCVCLDTLALGNTNTTLTPCGHAYHLSCLLSSLRTKNLCPMCRGSLEDPRPKPTTTNILLPANAEQIIRDELYWFPKSSYIQNIRGSNHPRRAFKEAARTFAYSVLQSAAEFVHADNVPEEWYSEDDTENESDDSESNSENENTDNENTDNENENTDNENTDNEDDTPRNQRQQDEDEFNYAEQLRIQAINEERTRGANHHPVRNMRLRSRLAEERGSNFDLRDELP
jgi:hypothetical protein